MILALCGLARATTWNVPDDGTLQDVMLGIAAGDSILVDAGWESGTSEVLRITKSVTITGDSSDPARLPPLNISGTTVTISNATFPWVAEQEADLYAGSPDGVTTSGLEHMGIRAYASTVTLENVTVSDTDGLGIYAENSELSLLDCAVDRHAGYPGIGFYAGASAHALNMSGGTVQGNDLSGLVAIQTGTGRATVTVEDTAFGDNGGTSTYGLWLSGASASFTDVTFEDTDWSTYATGIYDDGGVLSLDTVTFTNMRDGYEPISVVNGGGSLYATDVTITWPDRSPFMNAAIELYGADDVEVYGLRIEDAYTDMAPLYLSVTGTATLDDLVIQTSSGAAAGALYYAGSNELNLTRARLCANSGSLSSSPGAMRVIGDLALSGSIISSNYGTSGIVLLKNGTATIRNVDFVGNLSTAGTLYSPSSSGSWSVINTIFDSETLAVGAVASLSFTGIYNLWWANGADGVGAYSSSDVQDDPRFVSTYASSDCDSYPILDVGSPAIDAGYGGTDADGSNWDIGAMSGSTPILVPLGVDADGDGYDSLASGGDDCNDWDAAIHPDAPEIAYDGVDQDCSGGDLVDQDGDGYVGWPAGGDDCDDTDPTVGPCDSGDPDTDTDTDTGTIEDVDKDGYLATEAGGTDCDDTREYVHPGAWDDPDTPIDEDCDGENAVVTLGGGCGCASPGTGDRSTGALVIALGLLLRLRRNRSEPALLPPSPRPFSPGWGEKVAAKRPDEGGNPPPQDEGGAPP